MKTVNKETGCNAEYSVSDTQKATRLRQYGLTQKQYDKMIASQKNLCPICRVRLPVVIDHCHKTGKVRGVLCIRCNAGMGMFGDDPALCVKAARYLDGGLRIR